MADETRPVPPSTQDPLWDFALSSLIRTEDKVDRLGAHVGQLQMDLGQMKLTVNEEHHKLADRVSRLEAPWKLVTRIGGALASNRIVTLTVLAVGAAAGATIMNVVSRLF